MRVLMSAWLLALLLGGCTLSGSLSAPVPARVPVLAGAQWWVVENRDNGQQSLLAVQPHTEAGRHRWRWVQTDAFGAPLARQWMTSGARWQNDGLLPPNPAASRLFAATAALLQAETDAPLFDGMTVVRQGAVAHYRRAGREWWRIETVADGVWRIDTAAGEHWQLRRIGCAETGDGCPDTGGPDAVASSVPD